MSGKTTRIYRDSSNSQAKITSQGEVDPELVEIKAKPVTTRMKPPQTMYFAKNVSLGLNLVILFMIVSPSSSLRYHFTAVQNGSQLCNAILFTIFKMEGGLSVRLHRLSLQVAGSDWIAVYF